METIAAEYAMRKATFRDSQDIATTGRELSRDEQSKEYKSTHA